MHLFKCSNAKSLMQPKEFGFMFAKNTSNNDLDVRYKDKFQTIKKNGHQKRKKAQNFFSCLTSERNRFNCLLQQYKLLLYVSLIKILGFLLLTFMVVTSLVYVFVM